MKSIRLEEGADLKLKELAKEFRMSKKNMVNMILENLNASDVEMFQKRDRGGIPDVEVENDEGEWDVIEFEDDDDEEEENPYEDEAEEHTIDQEFSPAEIKRKQLELAAIKAGFVSNQEREDYMDEASGD